MSGAATITVAEVEHEAGTLDPNLIFLEYSCNVFQGSKYEKELSNVQ
jgi:hypothetical protein